MGDKRLSEKQKVKLAQLLSDAVANKDTPHILDLGRAAVILYDVNKLGYDVVDIDVGELIEKSPEPYSEFAIKLLKSMANAYHSLIFGLKDGARRLEESDLE